MIAPPTDRSRRAHPGTWLLGVLVVLAGLLLGGAPAAAHTGFDSSVPVDGSTVDAPVDTVTVTFTGEPTPVGEGFVALDPSGEVRTPTDVSVEDGRIFVLDFDPPLAGGDVGVRWSVQAADGHVLEGAFSFTVTAPAPTTAPPATTPTTAPATEPDPAEPDPAEPVTTDVAAAVGDDGATDDGGTAVAGDAGAVSLEEFLAVDDSVPGEGLGRAGRTLGFLGVALAVGGIAFLASTLRGTPGEIGLLVLVARAAGAAVALGAAVEYLGYVRRDGVSFGDDLLASPGLAMTLRVVGGLAIALGLRAAPSPVALSAAVVDDLERAGGRPAVTDGLPRLRRWRPASSPVALVGVALVVASFWFDGHTVSEGVRAVHALVDTVHVVAGSIWVGGVVGLAIIAWRRSRSGGPTQVGELVVRFSSTATVALAAVVVAGVLLAVIVLDSFGDLTGTEWGQVLLLKTAAVALAAGLGGYNHLVLRPALEADPDDPDAAARLRSTLTAEAILLGFVVVVTASLVVAATS